MARHIHILNASPNLAGMSLIIIAGLNVSDRARSTIADEIAWGATIAFIVGCLFSYLAVRGDRRADTLETLADRAFLIGLALLFVAVLALALHY